MPRKTGATPKHCRVPGCGNDATLITMLEDIYGAHTPNPLRFCERDKSLPFICTECAKKNEDGATGSGRSRNYPFSMWGGMRGMSGWTTYRDITTKRKVII